MRRTAVLGLIAVSLSTGPTTNPNADAPFSIVISAPQEPVRAGSEVRVKIALENTSNHEFTVARTNAPSQAEFNFVIDVRDERGQLAPDTEYGRGIMGRETKKRVIIYAGEAFFTLEPGETLVDEAVLSKLYDLSRPGKYFIQVARQIPENLGKGTVRSNIITMTITK